MHEQCLPSHCCGVPPSVVDNALLPTDDRLEEVESD